DTKSISMTPKIPLSSLLVLLSLLTYAQPSIDFELVASGFNRPVDISNANDGSDRLFVVEKSGTISIISDIENGTVLATPFLDISALVDDSGNEQGLLGLAFDPNYSSNGYFYINYTYDPGPGLDRTRIARYTVDANDANLADASSGFTILEIEQDFGNHNGGDLAFGPDGMLYIGMGDGGSGGDPNCRAQQPTSLLGKILRIDVHGTPPASPNDLCGLVTNYGIPADNPYAGGSGTCDEIWAFGMRNPWRISFDRATGTLWAADVGQNQREEIDVILGGLNYGWKVMEGTFCHDADPIDSDCPSGTASCGSADYTPPVFEYDHGLGCSVTGGYVYRGMEHQGMQGYYLFMDYCTNRIWSLIPDGAGGWNSDVAILGGFGNITTFGEDESGELYAASDGNGGNIYRVIDTNVSLPVSLLSFTGEITKEGNLLNWEAESLENFDRFEVERSADGQRFRMLGAVAGPDNFSSLKSFSYTDIRPQAGNNYYRLKMIDLDGSFYYSPLINLSLELNEPRIYPNPSSGTIYIDYGQGVAQGRQQLSLYNLDGKLVQQRVNDGVGLYEWDLSPLEKGLYILELRTEVNTRYQKILLR
ncbi:MAG: PQQ-dependent sugar dehydrogenase, partial [Bacteroidota bacterium]